MTTVYIKDYIISQAEGNLYWKNLKGEYLGCNQNFCRVAQLINPLDIVGKTDIDLFSQTLGEKRVQAIMDIDSSVINSKETQILEETGIDEHGNIAVYLTKKSPLKDEHGDIVGTIGTSIDITAEKREEKLAKEKEIAERTINYLKIVAASIAHEIKNPLSGIKTAAEVARIMAKKAIEIQQEEVEAKLVEASTGKTLPEKIKHYLDQVLKKVSNANAYISMQLANMRSNNIDTSDFTQCSISEVVKDALDTYSFVEERQQALVHWEGGKDFTFHGSPRSTRHVILNLLSNALHYIIVANKGEITIWLKSDNKYNYLYFKDTATGMPPEMAAKVFDQFFSKRENGTGLGLSLCKMVMQAYGGSITCEAEEDQYAQFILKFPKEK